MYANIVEWVKDNLWLLKVKKFINIKNYNQENGKKIYRYSNIAYHRSFNHSPLMSWFRVIEASIGKSQIENLFNGIEKGLLLHIRAFKWSECILIFFPSFLQCILLGLFKGGFFFKLILMLFKILFNCIAYSLRTNDSSQHTCLIFII